MLARSSRSRSTLLFTALAILAGIAVGLLFNTFSPMRAPSTSQEGAQPIDNSLADMIAPPESIKELVGKADMIIIGTVGPVVNQGSFSGYDQAGNPVHNKFPEYPNSDLPITDYAIKVEKVLHSPTSQPDKPIILRMIGHPITNDAERNKDRATEFPMSYPGDHHLFFLSRNPDGTYGLYYGAWSRLMIDGPVVTASNGRHSPVQFSNRTFTPTEFITNIVQTATQMSQQQ